MSKVVKTWNDTESDHRWEVQSRSRSDKSSGGWFRMFSFRYYWAAWMVSRIGVIIGDPVRIVDKKEEA